MSGRYEVDQNDRFLWSGDFPSPDFHRGLEFAMFDGVVFTDRYGGRSPSWLRGCHAGCEAMGVIPSNDPKEWPAGTRPVGTSDYDGTPDDGYRFIKCPDCLGTGRVSWWRTVARLPRWMVKGMRFVRSTWTYPGPMPGQSRASYFRVVLWAAYGADIAHLRR